MTSGWHVPFTIAFGLFSNWLREYLNPSLVHGDFAGRLSEVNSAYRSAHHSLVEHSESIIMSGGVERETALIKEKFGRLMHMWQELLVLSTKSSLSYRVINLSHAPDALINAMDLLLHIPLLSPNHTVRAAAGSSTQAGLQANAAMMGSMAMARPILFECNNKFQEMSNVRVLPSLCVHKHSDLNARLDLCSPGTSHPHDEQWRANSSGGDAQGRRT